MFTTKVVEKVKTYIVMSSNLFSENRVVYEEIWINIIQGDSLARGPKTIVYKKLCQSING